MFGFLKKSLKGGGTPAPEPAAPANPAAPEAAPETLVAPPTAPARPAPAAAPAAAAEPDKKRSWMDRLRAGLSRTRDQIGGGLSSLFSRRKIDEELLEELETTLLMADCGVEATGHLLKEVSHAGGAVHLVHRADLVPHHVHHRGRPAVFLDDQLHPVGQRALEGVGQGRGGDCGQGEHGGGDAKTAFHHRLLRHLVKFECYGHRPARGAAS